MERKKVKIKNFTEKYQKKDTNVDSGVLIAARFSLLTFSQILKFYIVMIK
jgi:hypothetical protein